jgi:long-chain acyl-CoA synthetase
MCVCFQQFWNTLEKYGNCTAIIDSNNGAQWSYSQLHQAVEDAADSFLSKRKLLAVLHTKSVFSVIKTYLGLLRAGHAIILVDGAQSTDALSERISLLKPDLVISPPDGFADPTTESKIFRYNEHDTPPLYRDLALLLSTSGSIGSQKFVRLSYDNLAVAAYQVQHALHLCHTDRAVTSLPLHHVYGLSVLHSQLAAGGAILLTNRSAMDARFWQDMRTHCIGSLAGVPWTFQAMQRMAASPQDFPHLRKLTNSAGRLSLEMRDWLLDNFSPSADIMFMYGQTEASGRISVLPAALARKKPDSVGQTVPLGRIRTSENGEIIFQGPNVMLGYAKRREDLARDDDMQGVLPTGDLGRLDTELCLYLDGRIDRVCKLLGVRIELDAVEGFFRGAVAATTNDDQLILFCEAESERAVRSRTVALADVLAIPRASVHVRRIATLPRTNTGKIMYAQLS